MSSVVDQTLLPIFFKEADQLVPTKMAVGPWYEGTQHGSSMMLLAAYAADTHCAGTNRQVTRLTVDMMKAVPMAPVKLVTDVRRSGKYMDVLDISVQSKGEECVRASALCFRMEDVPVAERVTYQGSAPQLPPPLKKPMFADSLDRDGFHNALDLRIDLQADPAVMWFRLLPEVVAGETVSPLLRTALCADWTYSIPNIAHRFRAGERFEDQSFFAINPDTTINLYRQAVGEWVGLQTHMTYGHQGAGTVSAQLFDEEGAFGYSSQSVLIRGVTKAPMHIKKKQDSSLDQ